MRNNANGNLRTTLIRTTLLLCFFFMQAQAFSFFEPLPAPQTIKTSLLTVGIGSGIEKRYGHSILRVSENKSGEEYLLNWGMFDWDQPYFVPRFLKGLLLYSVGESSFYATLRHYHEYENRSVVEDTIFLSVQQRDKLLTILNQRLQPDQIYFWYDFFYKNCSTIPRDILNEVLHDQLFKTFEKVPATQSLREYVRRNLNEWSIITFFLDIMLNSDVDAPISAWVEMFHPLMLQHYLSQLPQYDDAGKPIPQTKLLGEHHTIVEGGVYPSSPLNFFALVCIVCLLCLATAQILTRKKPLYARKILSTFCIAWGVLTGFLGTVLLAGWLFSNHQMLHHNANLFIFFPLDFLLIQIGLAYRKGSLVYNKRWMYFVIAHLVSLCIFAGVALFNGFIQDVSNVLKFVVPVQAVLYLMLLQMLLKRRTV